MVLGYAEESWGPSTLCNTPVPGSSIAPEHDAITTMLHSLYSGTFMNLHGSWVAPDHPGPFYSQFERGQSGKPKINWFLIKSTFIDMYVVQ